MNPHRRRITRAALSGALVLGATALLPATATAQAAWPAKPVRIVVPFGAGGVADLQFAVQLPKDRAAAASCDAYSAKT